MIGRLSIVADGFFVVVVFVLSCLNDVALRDVLIYLGAWSVYSTVRYFIAFMRFTSHDRQIIVLVLGSASALCTLLVFISLSFSALVACLGCKHANLLNRDNLYNTFQSLLGCSASFFLLGPPVVNLIFVVFWKSSSPDQTDRVSGRCSWDIDALWSGRSLPCDHTKVTPWGFWLVGAVARLFLSTVVAVSSVLTVAFNFTLTPSVLTLLDGVFHSQLQVHQNAQAVP